MNGLALRCCAVLLLLCCALFRVAPAHAGPTTCSATVTTLAFGSVVPASSLTYSTATLTYTCTTTLNNPDHVAACFRIPAGPFDSANANPRNMQNLLLLLLKYQIYQDSAYTIPWGSNTGTLGTQYYVPVLVPANGTTTGTLTIYGQVLAGQTTDRKSVV